MSNNGKVKTLPAIVPDKLQPHNVEAEEAVIGSLMIDPDAIIKVSTFLTTGDFYKQRNGWIFDVVKTLAADRTPADMVTVCDKLEQRQQLKEVGGPAYISGLINATPTSIHIEYYARIIERCAIFRRLGDAAGQIARIAYDDHPDNLDPLEVVNRAEEIIFNIAPGGAKHGLQPLRIGVDKTLTRIEYLSTHKGGVVGIPTGLTDLDLLLGGLQRSDMIVIAGRPGMGKTSLALSVAHHAARVHKQRVALFSLEMSDEQLTQRLLSIETGIDTQRLRFGDIKEDEWPTFLQASDLLSSSPIFIDDTPAISISDLRSKARRLHAEHGLDLLIVDYMQLMRGDSKSENRQQEISYISRSIKALARELNIPILALSQLSRAVESRQDKRPILSDLRESGSIEQDADIVLFIYRDDVYNPDSEFPNVAEIIVSKHRSGPTGVFSAYYKKHLCQFVGLDTRTEPLEFYGDAK